MQHGFILFVGSGPGVGKSTLSRFLFDQFTHNQIVSDWLHEDDGRLTTALELFGRDLQNDSPDRTASLLYAASHVATQIVRPNITCITDTFLPGYFFLVGHQTYPQLEAYTHDLYQILAPLAPLVVYLQCDVATGLQRAVASRGEAWLDPLLHRFDQGRFSFHPSKMRQDRRVAVSYFETVDRVSKTLLTTRWPGPTLILDTSAPSLDNAKAKLLQYLGLTEREIQDYEVSEQRLRQYVGVYAPRSDGSLDQPITITVRDGALFADVYWPNGTQLVAESETRFRLKTTSHWIEFELRPDQSVPSLVYSLRGNETIYDRIDT